MTSRSSFWIWMFLNISEASQIFDSYAIFVDILFIFGSKVIECILNEVVLYKISCLIISQMSSE